MPKADIQVVNNDDQIIGHKPRHEIDYEKDIYRTSGLWITNRKGEVLMAQRKLTRDKDPGKWGPAAAGTLEKDETYESNIYKEAEEEIGLKGVKFKIGPKQRVYKRNFFCQWFSAILDCDISEFKLQADEVEKIAWMPKQNLIKDVKNNPEKYTTAMPEIVDIFK